ncbi:MAG: hypothetical protein KDK48_01175 [Chlamydiia bacterium]|nr:hypothetical protein [Chlamydiia bacterium]
MNVESMLSRLAPYLYFTPSELSSLLDQGRVPEEGPDGVPFEVEILESSDTQVKLQVVWQNYFERLLNSFDEDVKVIPHPLGNLRVSNVFVLDLNRQDTVISGEHFRDRSLEDTLTALMRLTGYNRTKVELITSIFNQRTGIDGSRLVSNTQERTRFAPLKPEKGEIRLSLEGKALQIEQTIRGKIYDFQNDAFSDWGYECVIFYDLSTKGARHTITLSKLNI